MTTAILSPLGAMVDALATVGELRRRGLPDLAQLEFAAAEGWTIFTFDMGDFSQLHWQWVGMERNHAGIILEPNAGLSVGEMLRRFRRLFDQIGEGTFANRLEYLSDYR